MSEPLYYIDTNKPDKNDSEMRLMHKVAGSLYNQQPLLQNISDKAGNVILTAEQINLNTDNLETLITAGNASLTSIASEDFATQTTLSALNAKVTAVNTGAVVVSSSALPADAATQTTLSALNAKVTAVNTGAVVVSSSALPAGAATDSKQDTGNGYLSTISTKDFATQTTLSALNAKVTAVNTGAVVVSSSALPADAATQTTLSALNAKVTAVNTGAVVVSSSALPADAATQTTLAALNAKVTAVNTGAVTVSSSALPAGAATEATLAAMVAAGPKASTFDIAGRTRVSQLNTLHDGKVINNHRTLVFELVGTGTFTEADNKITMAVTSGQYCVLRTRRYFTYLSGKACPVEETFDGFAPQANVKKRFGYFSSNAVAPYDSNKDGFWIESFNGSITFQMERSGTSKQNVDITAWTGYANMGAYQSMATWDNFTVCESQFIWLGGAAYVLLMKIGSAWVVVHRFDYAGTAQGTFMKSPCQTVRYEVRSTTGTGAMNYICSQVSTEGSVDEAGFCRHVNTGTAVVSCATIGTTYPIKAVRKQSAYRDTPCQIDALDMKVASNDDVLCTLQLNPTLSAPLTYTNIADSGMQDATGNGTITVTAPGSVLYSQYFSYGDVLSTSDLEKDFLTYLGSTIDDVMDQMVLCITPITSNVSVRGGMGFKEF